MSKHAVVSQFDILDGNRAAQDEILIAIITRELQTIDAKQHSPYDPSEPLVAIAEAVRRPRMHDPIAEILRPLTALMEEPPPGPTPRR